MKSKNIKPHLIHYIRHDSGNYSIKIIPKLYDLLKHSKNIQTTYTKLIISSIVKNKMDEGFDYIQLGKEYTKKLKSFDKCGLINVGKQKKEGHIPPTTTYEFSDELKKCINNKDLEYVLLTPELSKIFETKHLQLKDDENKLKGMSLGGISKDEFFQKYNQIMYPKIEKELIDFDDKIEPKELQEKTKYKLSKNIINLEKILNGEHIKVLQKNRSKREFSVLSNLPKTLTRYLVDSNGKKLKNIDASNCFPFLLGIKILTNTGLSENENNTDVKLFLELTENAEFYNYISLKSDIEIDKVKIQMSQYISSPKTHNKVKDFFKDYFPTIYKYLEKVNKYTKNGVEHEVYSNDRLNNWIMRIESYIFQKTRKELIKNHPNSIIYTKHDSIYFSEDICQNVVINKIQELFKKKFNDIKLVIPLKCNGIKVDVSGFKEKSESNLLINDSEKIMNKIVENVKQGRFEFYFSGKQIQKRKSKNCPTKNDFFNYILGKLGGVENVDKKETIYNSPKNEIEIQEVLEDVFNNPELLTPEYIDQKGVKIHKNEMVLDIDNMESEKDKELINSQKQIKPLVSNVGEASKFLKMQNSYFILNPDEKLEIKNKSDELEKERRDGENSHKEDNSQIVETDEYIIRVW